MEASVVAHSKSSSPVIGNKVALQICNVVVAF